MKSLLRLATEPKFAFTSRVLATFVATACAGLQPLPSAAFSGVQAALHNELVMASVVPPLVDRHDFINDQESRRASDGMIELEKLFLMCQQTAEVGMLDAHEAELCPVVSEQLSFAKFGGDLDRLLEWSSLQRESDLREVERADVVGQCGQEKSHEAL